MLTVDCDRAFCVFCVNTWRQRARSHLVGAGVTGTDEGQWVLTMEWEAQHGLTLHMVPEGTLACLCPVSRSLWLLRGLGLERGKDRGSSHPPGWSLPGSVCHPG